MTNSNADYKVQFFVDETDNRIAKVARNFCRTQSIEEIQQRWSHIRLGIKRFARDQRRKALKRKDYKQVNRKVTISKSDSVIEQSSGHELLIQN
ncbi:unnamed protein product [Thelazia callipaeda]|uniref:Transposase n=1 Tax=Thelazia callipaeda TaxID=103827 RepID=A0A0N5CWY9_THECL|nr:unnamed protein product [Thelazia callipaeda]